MSGYWSAMAGTALILSPEEYDNMLLNYLKTAFKPDADKKDASHYMNSCEELSDEVPVIKLSCLDVIVDYGITKEQIIENVNAQKYVEGADYFLMEQLKTIF